MTQMGISSHTAPNFCPEPYWTSYPTYKIATSGLMGTAKACRPHPENQIYPLRGKERLTGPRHLHKYRHQTDPPVTSGEGPFGYHFLCYRIFFWAQFLLISSSLILGVATSINHRISKKLDWHQYGLVPIPDASLDNPGGNLPPWMKLIKWLFSTANAFCRIFLLLHQRLG